MDLKNRRVLVTGGAGVIGRELIDYLAGLGAHVLCVDREPKPATMPDVVRYHREDIVPMSPDVITSFAPEVIFHLAASFERTQESPEFWDVNYHDNILATHRVIEAAKNTGSLKKFIFASSYLVYAPSLYLSPSPALRARPINEGDSVDTRNLIGSSKYYNEKELEFINRVDGRFTVVSARIFRVYGRGSHDVISRWVRLALSRRPLSLFNKDNLFDYIFAADVALGLIKLARKVDNNEVVNLGCGRPRRVEEVIRIIESEIGYLKIEDAGAQQSFEASCADISKLIKLTSWQPSVDLESGIRMVIEHERAVSPAAAAIKSNADERIDN